MTAFDLSMLSGELNNEQYFSNDNQLSEKLRPVSLSILKDYLFGYDEYTNLSGSKIDKEQHIDYILTKGHLLFKIQEKIRRYTKWLKHKDFTMEMENGDGKPGEWHNLKAQLYLYAWSNTLENDLVDWMVINIDQLKRLDISKYQVQTNDLHGKAKFVSIPLKDIKYCIIDHSKGLWIPAIEK